MPVTAYHILSATTPDDPTYEIKPSDWNSQHALTLNAVGSEISGAFGNGGGVTFGLSADGKITASAPAAGGGLTNINVSAGTTSNNLSAFQFNNSNGVSFGLDGSTITATVRTDYLTTAMASNRGSDFVQATAAFAGTNASGTIASNGISVSVGNYITTARASNDAVGLNTALTAGPLAWTVNSNGISLNASSAAGTTSGFAGNLISGSMTHNTAGLNLSLNHPAWLTTAMQSNAATISNIRVSAGTTSNLLSAITFDNANGITWGLNASTLTASHNGLTTARASTDAIGLNTAQTNVTWTVNSSGLSFNAAGYAGTATTFGGANISGSMTLNSNGLNLSLSGAGGGTTNQTGPNIAAGTQTATSGTVVFSNSNGVSFGMSNSSVVTASFDPINIGVSDIGNTSGTTGTIDGHMGQYVFVGGNGITLSQSTNGASSGTVTISAQTQATASSYAPPWAYSGMATNSSIGNSTLYFMPVDIPDYLYVSRINFYVSINLSMSAGNSTGTCSAGLGYGIYTLNSDSLSRLTSYSAQLYSISFTSNTAFAATHYYGMSNINGTHSTTQTAISNANATTYMATNINGARAIALPVNSTLTPGRYWVGVSVQTVTGNALTNNLSVFQTSVGVQPDIAFMGFSSRATNASVFRVMQGFGSYSAQSAAWPNSIAYTTDNIRAAVAQTLIPFQMLGVSMSSNYL